jgi:UDP-N-acetylglucosamine acyltransferase
MLHKKFRKFPHSVVDEKKGIIITEVDPEPEPEPRPQPRLKPEPKREPIAPRPESEKRREETKEKKSSEVKIHPQALVDPKAELDEGVEIGPFTIVEVGVRIGRDTKIASNVLIKTWTTIGKNCQIGHGSVLGTLPQYIGFNPEEKTTLEIGDNNVIREYCTFNRGTEHRQKTVVGSNCFIMTYVHVAHDCILGNNITIANAVNMAGHVVIEDFVGIGGMVPIHQFVHIGCQSFIGGGYRIAKDVPPYILASGEPLTFAGLNSVGLRRRGFSSESLMNLKHAYRILYREHLNVSQAIIKIKKELKPTAEIRNLVDFVESSERGIIK